MKEFWSTRIRDAVPYVPGEQPRERKFIKLNTNENPYSPSPEAVKAMQEAVNDDLRLYPDPECTELRAAAAECWGVKPEQVFCGNGSDEILAFCFQAFFDPGKEIVFPKITYSFYPVYVDYFGLNRREVPMNPDFSNPIDLLCGNNGGVVLANPNAPTGIAVGLDVVEKLLQANPNVVVVVDEAYVDFGAESAVKLIDRYPNLVVAQTLSKSRSLAGLRVGFAIAQENLINALRCVRDSINSYTVDRVAQAGAAAALRDKEYFDQTRQKVMGTRAWTDAELKKLGFITCPSQTNFIFACHPEKAGKEIFAHLRQEGVLVRRWDIPEISEWLRISIGTEEEMKTMIKVLKGLFKIL